MKNVLKPSAKRVLIPLALTAAVTAIDAAAQKNVFGSGMTTLTISKEEMMLLWKSLSFLKNLAY